MVNELIELIKEEVAIGDRQQLEDELFEAYHRNRFRVVYNLSCVPIGFYTFTEVKRGNYIHIYLSNCYIKKEHRGTVDLREIKRFFQAEYQNLGIIYWHREFTDKYGDKKEKFYYLNGVKK